MAAQADATFFDATLTPEQIQALTQFAKPLSPAQLLWASGFLSGLAAPPSASTTNFDMSLIGTSPHTVVPPPSLASATDSIRQTTILYGSESGNGQSVAEALAGTLDQRGLQHTLINMSDYNPKTLKKESNVIVVVSTHGEGDPPEDAEEFYEFLMSQRAPKLAGLSYAVLALGDSSYAYYCETGRRIDERLAELGATPMMPRVDCDVDFKSETDAWSVSVLDRLTQQPEGAVVTLHPTDLPVNHYDKNNPLNATLLVNQPITGRDSKKAVHHLEIDIEDKGLTFEPGDSLAIIPKNPRHLVDEVLELTGLGPDDSVTVDGSTLSLATALTDKLELSNLSSGFLTQYAQHTQSDRLLDATESPEKRAQLFADHQIIDILRSEPKTLSAQDLVDTLSPISPRLYSIASSQDANPDEIHLTADVLTYESYGLPHYGVASHDLTQGTEDKTRQFSVYVDRNPKFRLPDNPEAPIIMIGPGTGVAPFRAFLQHREHHNASGKNWLFFGAQHFQSDFLYQMEWLRYRKQGLLTKLSTAFSRDQEEKVYVQHRMLENAESLFEWLESGAFVYVCGDAKHMASDIHDALTKIIMKHGDLGKTEAHAYLKQLRREGRYQKDVY